MTISTRIVVVAIGIVGNAALVDTSPATDLVTMGFNVTASKVEGPYELKSDGLIGFVTERLRNNQVKFTSCSNSTVLIDFKMLVESKAQCPEGPRGPGVWNVVSKFVAPIFKKDSDPNSVKVQFQGQDFDLSTLPIEYKRSVASMKAGDMVGIAFTDTNGKKTLGIIEQSQQ